MSFSHFSVSFVFDISFNFVFICQKGEDRRVEGELPHLAGHPEGEGNLGTAIL